MINYSTNKLIQNYKIMDTSKIRDPNKTPLFGKAILLIGNDTAVIKSLVVQLAQKGADIAVLCWQIPGEVANWLEQQAKAFSRKLYLVEQAKNQDASMEDLVHKIAAEWGRFDIFIDVSAKETKSATEPEEQALSKTGHTSETKSEEQSQKPKWHPQQWHLTQVVLEEMVRN